MNDHLNVHPKFSNTLYKILDTAFLLFVEKGYDAVTITDIYKQTGVSRGAVRGYFEQKIELLNVLASEVLEEINRNIFTIMEDNSLSFQEKLTQLLELPYQHPNHFNLVQQADNIVDPEQKLITFKDLLEESKTHLFQFFDTNIHFLQTTNKQLQGYSSTDTAILLFSFFESLYENSFPKVAQCSKETIQKNIDFILRNEPKE